MKKILQVIQVLPETHLTITNTIDKALNVVLSKLSATNAEINKIKYIRNRSGDIKSAIVEYYKINGSENRSEAFTKEKDGVSQMQAIDFLKGQGYKNITDIWVFEWQSENRKYINLPYAPQLECVQCLDNGLQAQMPDIDKSEIEVFALSDEEDRYLTTDFISSINGIDKDAPKTVYYIVVPNDWYDNK